MYWGGGTGGALPHILNQGTRQRWAIRFSHRHRYTQGESLGTYRRGCCAGPIATFDAHRMITCDEILIYYKYCCPCAGHESVWEGGGTTPLIPKLGTRWTWVVSFTPRQFYPSGNSTRHLFSTGTDKPWSISERFGGQKYFWLPSGIETIFVDPARSLLTFQRKTL
jgi:hypothetical protein